MRTTFGYVISIGEEEHVCRVTGTYTRGYPASYWGNYPEPGEPESFDVEKAEIPIAIRQFGKPTGLFRHLDLTDALTEAQINDIAQHGLSAARECLPERRRSYAGRGGYLVNQTV